MTEVTPRRSPYPAPFPEATFPLPEEVSSAAPGAVLRSRCRLWWRRRLPAPLPTRNGQCLTAVHPRPLIIPAQYLPLPAAARRPPAAGAVRRWERPGDWPLFPSAASRQPVPARIPHIYAPQCWSTWHRAGAGRQQLGRPGNTEAARRSEEAQKGEIHTSLVCLSIWPLSSQPSFSSQHWFDLSGWSSVTWRWQTGWCLPSANLSENSV